MSYLEECVRSVAAQTLSDIEIILVDDGSNDSSAKIADDFARADNRIKVIHQSNRGVSAARNAGLDAAKGDYIGFVDADDLVAVTMYEALYRTAAEHKVDLVVCVAAALRRGIKEEVLAPGFRISGLGQLVDSGIKADRMVTFGD